MPDQYDIIEELGKLMGALHPTPSFLAPTLNDTTLVIVATSIIDKFLEIVLISGFHKDIVGKRLLAAVFEGQGALATFSSKTSLCNLLGLTTADVRHDLTILRKVRNAFAHSREELSLKQFPVVLGLKAYSALEIEDSDERKKFKHSCVGIIGQLSIAAMVRVAQHRFVTKNPEEIRKEYDLLTAEAETPSPLQ